MIIAQTPRSSVKTLTDLPSFGQRSIWPCPAKLNLFLYINNKRADGYHELQTLFQFLDRSDRLTITPTQDGQLSLSGDTCGVSTENNLIWRAANALKQKSQTPFGAHIQLDKILPIGGGIGGGSSNAATTLVALNQLWKTQLSTDELAQIGLTLGADVPIFIHGHSAFAEGVGEQITSVVVPELWYLIIKPQVSIATAEIFSHPNLCRNTPKRPFLTLNNQPYENDCEKIVRLLYPEVDKQLLWLLKYAPSRLTGTGSCIFSEFSSEEDARNILEKLPNTVEAFVAKGCNRSPLHQTLTNYTAA